MIKFSYTPIFTIGRAALLTILLAGLIGCAEMDTLRTRVGSQDKLIAQLRKDNAEFQKAYYEIKERMEGDTAKWETDRVKLERDLEQAKNLKTKQETELADQLRTLNLEFNAYKSETNDKLKVAETQNSQLQQSNQAVQAERDAALARLADLDEKLRTEKKRADDLTQESAKLKVDVQAFNDQVGGLQKDLAARDKALKDEKTARTAAEKARDETAAKLAESQKAAAELQKQSQAAQASVDKAQADLKAGQDAKSALAKQVETLTAQAKESAGQGQDHAKQIETLKADLAKAQLAGGGAAKTSTAAEDPELKTMGEQLTAALKPVQGGDQAKVATGPKGLVITLPSDTLFDKGAIILSDRSHPVLDAVAAALAKAAGRTISIVGYTDNEPIQDLPYADNWGLGFARADRVREYLMKQGNLPGKEIIASTRAQYSTLAANDTAEGKAKNRRVEITVGPKS